MNGKDIITYAIRGDMPDTEDIREKCHKQAQALTQAPTNSNMKGHMYMKKLIPIAACLIAVLAVAVTLLVRNGGSPAPALQGEAFVFNNATSVAEVSVDRQVDFIHDLTNQQLNTIFPNLELPVNARAFYLNDGTLIELEAFNHNYGVHIRLAEGQLVDTKIVVYENATPQISYVHGVPVTAYMYGSYGARHMSFMANFMLGQFAYRVVVFNNEETGKALITDIVGSLIAGGTGGLYVLENPTIPEYLSEVLSIATARLDPVFGAYVPNAPDGFYEDFVYRFINQHNNALFARWTAQPDYEYFLYAYTRWRDETPVQEVYEFEDIFWQGYSIIWQISKATAYDLQRIVCTGQPERYDWSVYPVNPYTGGLTGFPDIPGEYWYVFMNPVFLVEELTLDVVQARHLQRVIIKQGADGAFATDDNMMDIFIPIQRSEIEFSVLHGDVVIHVRAEGVTAEDVWGMFVELGLG